MKAMKKIISLALVTTMVSSVNLQMVARAEGNVLLKENFNSVSSVSDLSENWDFYYYPSGSSKPSDYTPEVVSDNGGKAIKLSKEAADGQTRAVYSFPESLDGSLKIKYSIKPGENISTLVSLNDNSNWVTCFGPDNSLLFRWAGTDTIPYTLARNLSYNEWYDVELYVDLVGKKSQIKVSDRKGNSWESDTASIDPDKYNKLYFRCWGDSASSFCLDDVEVEQIPLGFGIGTDKVGNIFDQNDNETFAVTIGNSSSEKINGAMEWEVENEYTGEVKRGSTTFNIAAKRDKSFNLTLDVKKFGTYTLTTKVKYFKDGVLIDENEPRVVKFSKILASDSGERNPQFGFATANITLDPGTAEQALTFVDKAGGAGIRNIISWQTTETSDRVLGFNNANQSVVDALGKRNTTDMITLAYGHKDIVSQTKKSGVPGIWEWETEMDPSHYRAPWKDEDLAAFGRYCAYVAQNTDAPYFEIWNEWEGENFNVDGLGYDAYVNVLKAAYTAIKEVRPDAMVFSNSFGDNNGFTEAMNAGMYEYCDGFICHGYMAQSYFPNSHWLEKFQDRLQIIRDYEAKKGYTTQKYMYFNENGISTAVDYVPNNNNWRTVTEAEQAEIAAKYMAFARGYDLTDSIYWFTLLDTGVNSAEKEDMWGVMYYPKNFEKVYLAKPAYASIAAMNKLMNGGIENTEWPKYEVTEERNRRWNANGSNLEPMDMMDCYLSCAYAFERKSNDGLGEHIAVIWSDEKARDYVFNLGCKTVDMYDLFGNKSTLSSEDGIYKITVDDTLVYLVGDFTSFEKASGSISTAEYDAEKNIMHISGFVNDSNLADGSEVSLEAYKDDQIAYETTVKVIDGSFDKMFSLTEGGTYTIKVGNYAEREITIVPSGDYAESVVSLIDSGVSIYVDEEKNICVNGKVNNFAENENVSLIVVPLDSEVKKENILYIRQLDVADDGSFSDKIKLSGTQAAVDVYIGATNASAIQSEFVQNLFKVTSLNLEEQDEVIATAIIYNTTDVDEDAVIIVAQYNDDDVLVGCSTKDIKILKNITSAQVFEHSVKKRTKATKYKAFIWKSTTDLTPLFGTVSIGEWFDEE